MEGVKEIKEVEKKEIKAYIITRSRKSAIIEQMLMG